MNPRDRTSPTKPSPAEPSVLIVCGAHPDAEREDRPRCYDLVAAIGRALDTASAPAAVMTDLWYLNHDALGATPAVCVGPPERNALSAYLADKLPSVFAEQGSHIVQLDTEQHPPLALCWGAVVGGRDRTGDACDVFVTRHLHAFLAAAGLAPAGGPRLVH